MHRYIIAGTALSSILLCFPAYSAPASAQIWHEYTDFSGEYGKRNVTNLEPDSQFHDVALITDFATGERRYDNGKTFHGNKGRMALNYDRTPQIYTRYQYTRYYNAGTGQSYSHVTSLKINDEKGSGSTQLWFEAGTGAYTLTGCPGGRSGKLYSLALKRSQPLMEDFIINASAGKQWYDTPVSSFSGIMGMWGGVYYF